MKTEDILTYFETQSHLITIPVPTNTNPKHLETNISQSSCSTNPPKTTPKHNPPQKSDHRNKFRAPNYNPHTQNTNTWLIKLQKHQKKSIHIKVRINVSNHRSPTLHPRSLQITTTLSRPTDRILPHVRNTKYHLFNPPPPLRNSTHKVLKTSSY